MSVWHPAASMVAVAKDGLAYRLRSIFKLTPQIKRIFLFVRPTNEIALGMYKDLEFVPDIDLLLDPHHKVNINYLTPLEYTIELGHILQKTVEFLKDTSVCKENVVLG